jgi:hypothetical protein
VFLRRPLSRGSGALTIRALPAGAEEDCGFPDVQGGFSRQFLSKIDGFCLWRRCAGEAILAWSRRFEAALLGRAGLLFMRLPRSR